MATKRKSLTLAAVKSRVAASHAAAGRLRERDPKERRCAFDDCGKAFRPVRDWQKYCTSLCRYKAWDVDNPRVRIKKTARR